jgi:hypothetical protein
MRWTPDTPEPSPLAGDYAITVSQINAFGDAMVALGRSLIDGMAEFARRWGEALSHTVATLEPALHALDAAVNERAHRRCATCHPGRTAAWSYGAEYHRRLKARGRRKRRR